MDKNINQQNHRLTKTQFQIIEKREKDKTGFTSIDNIDWNKLQGEKHEN